MSLSVRGLPCGPPNRSSAVRMCRLARIAAMIPSTRFRPSSIWGTGAEPHATVALGYQLESSMFAFCSPIANSAGNFCDEGKGEREVVRWALATKYPQYDFGRRGRLVHLSHDTPVPLFRKSPKSGIARNFRTSRISGNKNAIQVRRPRRLPSDAGSSGAGRGTLGWYRRVWALSGRWSRPEPRLNGRTLMAETRG
jgi:hypothetical protein